MTLTIGTTVVIGRTRVGTITRIGRHGGASGYWIAAATGDPGARGGLSSFASEHSVRPAVVGDNVCATPKGACFCGSAHVTDPDALPGAARQTTPVHRLRVGDTWTEHGHTRRVTSRPQPRGDGSYTFTTVLVPSGAPETHVLPADRELETTR